MRGLEIHDKRPINELGYGGGLSFDLADVLELLKDKIIDSQWRVSHLWCMGERTEEFKGHSDTQTLLPSDFLLELAHGVFQVINGIFKAFHPNEDNPWLIVMTFDSSFYEVWTDDETILERVRSHFNQVTEANQEHHT